MQVVKVSEVSGPALDWLVATCEGHLASITESDEVVILREGVTDYFDPHRNWGWAGPIIEREKIGHCWCSDGYSQAHQFDAEDEFNSAFYQTGPTPLIAAMRCYVASKLGETVEVPDELFKSIN